MAKGERMICANFTPPLICFVQNITTSYLTVLHIAMASDVAYMIVWLVGFKNATRGVLP